MNNSINIIKAIFVKDLINELRSKQTFASMVVLSIIIAWIFRLISSGVESAMTPVAAAVIMVSVVFSSILCCERSFAVEHDEGCIDGLLSASFDKGDIYLGKLFFNITMLCIFDCIMVPVVCVCFNLAPVGNLLKLVIILLLVNIGVSATGTLLGSVVMSLRGRSSTLSILIMALIMPMMIPAISGLMMVFSTGADGGMFADGQGFNAIAGVMAAYDAIFVTVCWLVFGFTVS